MIEPAVMARTITRRIEFDAAHRVMEHESKCRNLHGHRYAVEITCTGELDKLGRIVDFSAIKERVGGWIDRELDHGTLLNLRDCDLIELCVANEWKHYVFAENPTAENIAEQLFHIATQLLEPLAIKVTRVRVYETPNCWADHTHDAKPFAG